VSIVNVVSVNTNSSAIGCRSSGFPQNWGLNIDTSGVDIQGA